MPPSDNMKGQRRHSSNIGIRRQHLGSRSNSATVDRIRSEKISPDKIESSASQSAGQQPRRSRTEQLKRQELIRINYNPQNDRDLSSEQSLQSESLAPQFESDPSGTAQPSSDSEGGSPPILLVNPNAQVLPVVKTEQARGAFDFYINSFAVSITEVSTHNIAQYSQIVHQILHDELLFTAFTTCSEASRWRAQTLYDDPPLGVVKGYGKTIALLTQKLQQDKFAMSPTILLTMGQLVAIEILIKNVSATARHLAGMQAAMKSKTSEDGAPKPVQNAVNIWTQYFIHRATVSSTISKNDVLNYPRHPFDPKLSMLIADLPAGFADITLSGRISVQMLNLLEKFNTYFTTINTLNENGILDSPERTEMILLTAAHCIEYHLIRTQSIIERLLLTALTAYVVRRDRIHPAMINMRNYYQITCAYLGNLISQVDGGFQKEDHGSDLLTWAGLMLLLTSTPEAHARKLALRLLPKQPEPLKLLKKCEQFFWDDDLTNALLSGRILVTRASNDIIADNIKQVLSEAEPENSEET